ncbi:HIT domain-containing protein [Aeromicrobium sp. CTD01-1L150]|uniref:HIT family protein n=1 Tax=Aeromicrobium sp. CTD01-1L150 TaxID=3341830 RepID=UPI0035C18239
MNSEDHLQRLWAPYRMSYVRGEEPNSGLKSDDSCPFCRIAGGGAQSELVVHRGATCFVVLNLYPYNPGHLMVVPQRHVADYTDLDDVETAEVATLTQEALRAIRTASQPHGFNVGLNLGGVAGGSLSQHLHQHVVPRWSGDANFMTVLGRTKTLPQLLEDTRDLLADAWPDATSKDAP